MARRRSIFYDTLLLTGANLMMRGVTMAFQVFLVGRIGAGGVGLLTLIHTVQALANGTDMWCYTSGTAADNRTKETNKAVTSDDDGNVVLILKEIAHRVYYTYSHTNLMNGLSSVYNIVPVTPSWIYAIYGLNAVLWAIPVIFAIAYALSLRNKKKEEG